MEDYSTVLRTGEIGLPLCLSLKTVRQPFANYFTILRNHDGKTEVSLKSVPLVGLTPMKTSKHLNSARVLDFQGCGGENSLSPLSITYAVT